MYKRQVTEGANGEATISFSSEITNYKLQRIADPADKQTVYHLEVWTCAWDRMFSKPGAPDVTVKPENCLLYTSPSHDDRYYYRVCD